MADEIYKPAFVCRLSQQYVISLDNWIFT